jgi:hypothetical protein
MAISLGHVLATSAVIEHLTRNRLPYLRLVLRHMSGDWGEVESDDRELNQQSVLDGDSILSIYTIAGTEVCVFTRADRSYTFVLLASEMFCTD